MIMAKACQRHGELTPGMQAIPQAVRSPGHVENWCFTADVGLKNVGQVLNDFLWGSKPDAKMLEQQWLVNYSWLPMDLSIMVN